MAPNPKDFEKIQAKIIARAWKDPRFKEKLMKDPRAAFKEMGLDIPENVKVSIVEDKANAFTFVLPTPSVDTNELSDQALEKLAGGKFSVPCDGRTHKGCLLS